MFDISALSNADCDRLASLRSLKLDASLPVVGVPATSRLTVRVCVVLVCPRALPGESACGDELFSGVPRCRATGTGEDTRGGDCPFEFEFEWEDRD